MDNPVVMYGGTPGGKSWPPESFKKAIPDIIAKYGGIGSPTIVPLQKQLDEETIRKVIQEELESYFNKHPLQEAILKLNSAIDLLHWYITRKIMNRK